MLISLVEEVISEGSKLFLNETLKTWWKYHKIDRDIARRIEDTCKDEGVKFDKFLKRLGINEKMLRDHSKNLRKSFKKRKSFTGVESFIDEVVNTYLSFLRIGDTDVEKGRIKQEDINLIEKIRKNIQIYLINFKPVETIANININLTKIEAQNREYYEKLLEEVITISSQSEMVPENLMALNEKVGDALSILQNEHEVMLEKLDEMLSSQKAADTVSFNEYIDLKIRFNNVDFKKNSIGVESTYSITLVADSKAPFQVTQIGVNREPVDALISGKKIKYDSEKEGYYLFNLLEVLNCGAGRNQIATINIKGPKLNYKYELYIILEGKVNVDKNVYPIKKSKGPFIIERGSELEKVSSMVIGLMDDLFKTNMSETIKKIKDKQEEQKYL
ncbi:MAG: hypothetical protein ACW990_13065 [Promethearchaeota archaeon]|jgi:hypothetical protein